MKTQRPDQPLTFNFNDAHRVDKPHIEEFLKGVSFKGDTVKQIQIRNLLTSVTYESLEHLINAVTPFVSNFAAFRGYCNLTRNQPYFRNCF